MSSQLVTDQRLRNQESEAKKSFEFRCSIESLEERLALTTHALVELPELIQFGDISSTSDSQWIAGSADPVQQIEWVQQQFSLQGTGQTVAIIDSGIAWDHYALGGGLGQDFRVVGGWDFAENDADPFDDGPAGFHGTHVAGIVGSNDAEHLGVASDVDLVGLRVFDDYGRGKLEWVEQALQWVHDNRHSFENPITTVNLSLGTQWNSDFVPGWATLEDELAQLKNDGIFISVAAGNSFQQYLTPGVSYPAASEYVVPVGSHDASGQLSDFSQRNDRILAAPGEQISSTIPAQLYGRTGPSDQFLESSGTSMAAPFVAGSSVLLRQAFELAGENGIDQDRLYRHFMETADQVYDQITQSWYSRLNLKAAIEAALEDGHGDNLSHASRLGDVANLDLITGNLVQKQDLDLIQFRAIESGQVTLELETSHDLDLQLDILGQSFTRNGNRIILDVQAGQDYTLRLNANSGQGSYRIQTSFESGTPINGDFGLIRSNEFKGLSASGESFYRFTAARNAIMTVEAFGVSPGNHPGFEIYDSSGTLVAQSLETGNGTRTDFVSQSGSTYLIRITEASSSFDLKLTNLVRTAGTRVIAGGTGQADSHVYASTNSHHQITVNGTQYQFAKSEFSKIRLNGGTGLDALDIQGTSAAETLTGGSGQFTYFGSDLDIVARGFESAMIDGMGGGDLAVLEDSQGSDLFRGTSLGAVLEGGGYSTSVQGFDRITALSTFGGNDRAELIGSQGDDLLHIHRDGTSLSGEGFRNYVVGFEDVMASGGSGNDRVLARGSSQDESLSIGLEHSNYYNVQGKTSFDQFASVTVKSGGGNDNALLQELDSSSIIERKGNNVSGQLFGQQIVIENYSWVDWNYRDSEIPTNSLSAVERVFTAYAER